MPNRYIRDSLNMSKSLGAVSLLAEVLFTHLILAADDYGRYISEPQMLRGLLFSARPNLNAEQVAGALQELERERMIRQYYANERTYLWIVNWSKYQRARAKCSKFPAPNLDDASICKQMQADAADNDNEHDHGSEHDRDNADSIDAIMRKGSL
jgi:hypothetical protein